MRQQVYIQQHFRRGNAGLPNGKPISPIHGATGLLPRPSLLPGLDRGLIGCARNHFIFI